MAVFVSKPRALRIAGVAKFDNHMFITEDEALIAKLRDPALGYGTEYAEGPSVPKQPDTIISGTRSSERLTQVQASITPIADNQAERQPQEAALPDTTAARKLLRLGFLRAKVLAYGKKKIPEALIEEIETLEKELSHILMEIEK